MDAPDASDGLVEPSQQYGEESDHHLQVLLKGVERNPGSVRLRVALGEAHLREYNYRLSEDGHLEARRLFEEAALQAPDEPGPNLGLASFELGRRNWDECRRFIHEAERRITIDEDWGAYGSLVRLLSFVPDEREHLLALIDRVLARDPTLSDFNLLKGLVLEERGDPEAGHYLRLARQRWDDAEDFDIKVDTTRRTLRTWGPNWWSSPPNP
jgi:hypothetical protein